jgi:hypothetical protein
MAYAVEVAARKTWVIIPVWVQQGDTLYFSAEGKVPSAVVPEVRCLAGVAHLCCAR